MFLKRISRWKYFNFKKTIRFYEIYFNDFDDLRNGIIFIYECLKKDKCIGSIFNLELKTEIDFKNSRYLFKHNNLDYYLIDDINYLNDNFLTTSSIHILVNSFYYKNKIIFIKLLRKT